MKIALSALLFSIATSGAADDPQLLADRFETLLGRLDPTGPSTAQHEAFVELVKKGPKGWNYVIRAQFDTHASGDAARRIDSFWSAETISDDLVEGYVRARRTEMLKRVTNESWALLYAAASERVAFRPRGETRASRLDELFESMEKYLHDPNEALMDVAFLRVLLVDTPTFPGHRFPWTAPAKEQKEALRQLVKWWKKHRNEHKKEED